MSKTATEQLDILIKMYGDMRSKSQYDDLSDLHEEAGALANRLVDAVHRLSPVNSAYSIQSSKAINTGVHVATITTYLAWAKGLKDDIDAGFID